MKWLFQSFSEIYLSRYNLKRRFDSSFYGVFHIEKQQSDHPHKKLTFTNNVSPLQSASMSTGAALTLLALTISSDPLRLKRLPICSSAASRKKE